ncbi:serine protease SP24D-like [Musca domestica]|uniref:Serine protease SP24D-like n=1 Tax=Musca domestica TaxID=7370 RepID=A0A9J7D2Z5_MUSDO|nr:serine protease SP24D-like [Musca domestica]
MSKAIGCKLLFSIGLIALLHCAQADDDLPPVYPQPRILGGANANERQFPYQISLHWGGAHVCGGSIISPSYIVTAAHCLARGYMTLPPSYISIRAGSRLANKGGQLRQAEWTYIHPDYNPFGNDIGVVKLSKPLEFNENVRAIPLASEDPPTGAPVVISGWGRTSNNGTVVNQLQYTTLTALTSSDCRRRLVAIPDSIICFEHSLGHGACRGDSGGPAVYQDQLVGIANSVVRNCGSANPDTYTSAAYHAEWVRENTQG